MLGHGANAIKSNLDLWLLGCFWLVLMLQFAPLNAFKNKKVKGAAQAKKGLRKNNCSASLVPEIFKSHQR